MKRKYHIPGQPFMGWACAILMMVIGIFGLTVAMIFFTWISYVTIPVLLYCAYRGLQTSTKIAEGWDFEVEG